MIPSILWAQTYEQISLKLTLSNSKNISVNISNTNVLSFSCIAYGNTYEFDFELFSSVDTEHVVNNNDREIIIILKKNNKEWWHRLELTNNYKSHININWDEWIDEDECNNGEYTDFNMENMISDIGMDDITMESDSYIENDVSKMNDEIHINDVNYNGEDILVNYHQNVNIDDLDIDDLDIDDLDIENDNYDNEKQQYIGETDNNNLLNLNEFDEVIDNINLDTIDFSDFDDLQFRNEEEIIRHSNLSTFDLDTDTVN
jgi:hypothetical protein